MGKQTNFSSKIEFPLSGITLRKFLLNLESLQDNVYDHSVEKSEGWLVDCMDAIFSWAKEEKRVRETVKISK